MIKIAAALANVRELFLDTAPIIYHIEGNLAYRELSVSRYTCLNHTPYRLTEGSQ